jgi:hypothetical protein
MPRPRIVTGSTGSTSKVRAQPKKPKGLPKPKPEAEAVTPLSKAKKAVEEYEVQRRMLEEMQRDWETNFPEALLAQRDILEQEDRVHDAIKLAKPLVAQAKESVGPFKAQRKFSKPHYDAEEVTRIVASHEKGLKIFKEMLDDGVVNTIDLDKHVVLPWVAQRPEYSKVLEPAFRDEEEMTTAVTVPKL